MVDENDLPLGAPRLLEVTAPLLIPASVAIRILVTSKDVLHS
jgi:heme/copper-type cytochrome/quinol oxidase subunit 2